MNTTRNFYLYWLLITGIILVLIASMNSALDTLAGLSRLEIVQKNIMNLSNEVLITGQLPIDIGLILALLSPIISAVEYNKMESIRKENIKNVMTNRVKFLPLIAIGLAAIGIITSTLIVYLPNADEIVFYMPKLRQVITSIVLVLLFGFAIAFVGVLQLQQFIKWPKAVPTVITCILVILLGQLVVAFVFDAVHKFV